MTPRTTIREALIATATLHRLGHGDLAILVAEAASRVLSGKPGPLPEADSIALIKRLASLSKAESNVESPEGLSNFAVCLNLSADMRNFIDQAD
jgi:hypothetical protein